MIFNSYYWRDPQFSDVLLKHAYANLVESSWPASQSSLNELLDSADVVAQCVALDYFSYAAASYRWGVTPAPAALENKVADVARHQLRSAAVPSTTPSGNFVGAANYASACEALARVGDEADSAILVEILSSTSDPNVLSAAARALNHVLGGPYDHHALIATITRVIDGQLAADVKLMALLAMERFTTSEEADALLAFCSKPLPLGAYAALLLLGRRLDEYRDRVRAIALQWPHSAPYPAGVVREMLDGDSELRP